MLENKPKQADWAPGTLEKTRKALGDLGPDEAKIMSKVLGGEVMYERSNGSESVGRRGTGKIIRPQQDGRSVSGSDGSSAHSDSQTIVSGTKNRRHQEGLPPI